MIYSSGSHLEFILKNFSTLTSSFGFIWCQTQKSRFFSHIHLPQLPLRGRKIWSILSGLCWISQIPGEPVCGYFFLPLPCLVGVGESTELHSPFNGFWHLHFGLHFFLIKSLSIWNIFCLPDAPFMKVYARLSLQGIFNVIDTEMEPWKWTKFLRVGVTTTGYGIWLGKTQLGCQQGVWNDPTI